MALPEDWDVISIDPNEPDNDAICSVSEGEASTTVAGLLAENPIEVMNFMAIDKEDYGYLYKITLPEKYEGCSHKYEANQMVDRKYMNCSICKRKTN